MLTVYKVKMVAWAQLFLLACIIAMSASQGCDDATCCSGRVCVEETTRSGTNKAKCVHPTSCDQLDCPSGFTCVSETRGFGSTQTRVSCQASCDDVQCPPFLQCVERGSFTECVVPNTCFLVECPPGFECTDLENGRERVAVCLAESSCNSLDCFDGAICVDSIPLQLIGKSKSRTSTRSMTADSSGDASGQNEAVFATCVPVCEGADICPQGMVCDQDDSRLICREPQSCEELECSRGQECQEVICRKGRARRSTGTGTGTGTRTSNVLVSCADIDAASGSGDEETEVPVATTASVETAPPQL